MTASATRATRVRGHRRGCNCEDCARIYSRYKKHRSLALDRGTWQPPEDSAPWLAMLRDCRAAGWTARQIGAVTGLDYRLVRILLGDEASIPAPKELRAATVTALRRLAGADRFGPAVPDVAWLDATGARRRVQALAVQGWPQKALIARAGVRVNDINKARLIKAATARSIVAVYIELSGVKGPSSSAVIRARAKGWAPPAAWEGLDIDDPRSVPDLGAPCDPVVALVENAEYIRETDRATWQHAAERLRVDVNTLHTYRSRVRERATANTGGAA